MWKATTTIFAPNKTLVGLVLNFRMCGSVVAVAFQIAFRAEIHTNDVFLFFKNYF